MNGRAARAGSLPTSLLAYTLLLGIGCLVGSGLAVRSLVNGAAGMDALLDFVLAVSTAGLGFYFVAGVIVAISLRRV